MNDVLLEDFHAIANGGWITDVGDRHRRSWIRLDCFERVSDKLHILRNPD